MLLPFVGIEGGTMYGSGFGVVDPKHGRGLWLAATGAAQVRYRLLPWLEAQAELDAALPLLRPWYVLDNVGPVYRPDIITFRAASGLNVHF